MSVAEIKKLKVTEIMDKPVINTEDSNLELVYTQLLATPQEMVAIVDDQNALKGVVTKTRIMKGLLDQGKRAKIGEVMYKNPVSIKDNQTIEDAIQILNENKLDKAPVVDSNGKLVGVVSRESMLRKVGSRLSLRL